MPPAWPPGEGDIVTVRLIASGGVADYAPRVIHELRQLFAREAAVPDQHVSVSVVPASVLITIEIAVQNATVAQRVATRLGPVLSDATAASALLARMDSLTGIKVTSVAVEGGATGDGVGDVGGMPNAQLILISAIGGTVSVPLLLQLKKVLMPPAPTATRKVTPAAMTNIASVPVDPLSQTAKLAALTEAYKAKGR